MSQRRKQSRANILFSLLCDILGIYFFMKQVIVLANVIEALQASDIPGMFAHLPICYVCLIYEIEIGER